MFTSLRQLLSSIVDYAGLFPPAQLGLSEAVMIYDRAQSSPHSWMLDRFVLPISRLHELAALQPNFDETAGSAKRWSLSVILSKNWAAELELIHQINTSTSEHRNQFKIQALESADLSPGEIQQVCRHLSASITPFFEIPFDADLASYLTVLQETGSAAKLRTGGITSAAFPDSTQLSQRILALANAQIPFKATAGLHHPLRGNYRLTYQPNSTATTMHGFLNVAMLAALAYHQNISPDEAVAILEEQSICSFRFTDTQLGWRDRVLSLEAIQRSRQQFFRSFGSCSIQEPIDDLYQYKLL